MALFHRGVSREITPSLLSLERVLDTLYATQEVPRHARLHSRGTLRVPTKLKKSLVFPFSSPDDGPFPCFAWKGIPAFPSHFKKRWSQLESREELQESCHNSKRLSCPNPLQIYLIPSELTRLSPRVLTQNTMAGMKALWHLKRKPQIPTSTRQEA